MRLLFASLGLAMGVLTATPVWAQFQPVLPMCGDPPAPCSAANPLPVDSSAGGTSDVNLTEVAGAAVATGHGTAAGVLRVELPTDGTGVVGLNAGSALVGNVGVAQASTTSGQSGPLVQGAVTTGAPTYTNSQTSPLSLDPTGNLRVTGGVTQGSATAGQTASVVMGATTTAAPSYSTGTSNPVSLDTAGNIRNAPQASAAGGASFTRVAAGQATTTIKSGAGTLYAIVFSGPATATNTTTIYDNTAASGTIIAVPLATAVTFPTTLTFGPMGLAFGTGLTVITATANGADMTFIYK